MPNDNENVSDEVVERWGRRIKRYNYVMAHANVVLHPVAIVVSLYVAVVSESVFEASPWVIVAGYAMLVWMMSIEALAEQHGVIAHE